MKKKGLKIVSLILAMLMLSTCVCTGLSAFAAEDTDAEGSSIAVDEQQSTTLTQCKL